MPAQYYLPCACGQKHLVNSAQAGQTLTCACGATLHVPTLRGLAALEVAPEARPQPRSAWGPRQGVMLVAAALAVGALLAAAWLRGQAQPAVSLTSNEAAAMDNLSPRESWQAWRYLSSQGLHLGLDSNGMERAQMAGLWSQVAFGFAGFALVVAVLLALVPLVFAGSAQSPAANRPVRR